MTETQELEERVVTKHDISRREKGEDLARQVADALNDMGSGVTRKAFIDGMARQHRTLQQNFTGVVLQWLKHLAELPEGHFDGRNEASVKMAKKLLKDVDTKYDLLLPFI